MLVFALLARVLSAFFLHIIQAELACTYFLKDFKTPENGTHFALKWHQTFAQPCRAQGEYFMWPILLLLWSIPLTLGLVALARAATGAAAVRDNELRFLLGASQEIRFSIWMAIKFAVLAAVFSVVGLLEGAVLFNFGTGWMGLAAILTSSAATLVLGLWVRSAPSAGSSMRRRVAPSAADHGSPRLPWYRFARLRSFGASKRRKETRDSASVIRRYGERDF